MQERDILERAQNAQREQIERLRDQLDAARADAFTTQAQAESARELSEEIRAHEASALKELEAARAEATLARDEARRALEDKNKEVEERRKEVEEKAKEVTAKTKELEEKARLVLEKTKEAETARRDAQLARGEEEKAKVAAEAQAERVKAEMEKAKADAEAARAELDRARMEAEEAMRREVDVAVAGTDEGELQADENDEKVLERVRAGPVASIATQRDTIAGELVFLANRIAYGTGTLMDEPTTLSSPSPFPNIMLTHDFQSDIGVLMELSKALRNIRHSLDTVTQAAGMEEWLIAQLCRIYTSCLPSLLTPLEVPVLCILFLSFLLPFPFYSIGLMIFLQDLPPGDPPGLPDPHTDMEKVRKVRTIALHAARACIPSYCLLPLILPPSSSFFFYSKAV
jgi:hypothetical protein